MPIEQLFLKYLIIGYSNYNMYIVKHKKSSSFLISKRNQTPIKVGLITWKFSYLCEYIRQLESHHHHRNTSNHNDLSYPR